MSTFLHQLLRSARVYARTALEVAVLGADADLMDRETAVPRPTAPMRRAPGADASVEPV
ncbi:hypothetical protein ACFZAU_32115 [Streptomyces sp. NPDC008238]